MLIYDYTPLINIQDQRYPVYFPQVRQEYPNTGFPVPIEESMLVSFNYRPVLASDKPDYDENTSYVEEDAPVYDATTDAWYKGWRVVNYTPEEQAQRLIAAKNEKLGQAKLNFEYTKEYGVPYSLGDENYRVRLQDTDISALLVTKALLENSTQTSFGYKFVEAYISDISKDDMLAIIEYILETYYGILKRYWVFVDQVETTQSILDLPTPPDVFYP